MNQKPTSSHLNFAVNTHVNAANYDELYDASITNPEAFWAHQAERVDWMTCPTKIKNVSYAYGDVSIKWYEDGELNVAGNCIDRHLETRADQTAIIWEPDDPNAEALHITYAELHTNVSQMGNVLKSMGVRKGDRVVIYMPMIPEAAYAMLACARIGAIHSIVFAGFSPNALAARVNGCDAKVVITADKAPRGGKNTPLKVNADKAFDVITSKTQMLVMKRTGGDVPMQIGRDHWLHDLKVDASHH